MQNSFPFVSQIWFECDLGNLMKNLHGDLETQRFWACSLIIAVIFLWIMQKYLNNLSIEHLWTAASCKCCTKRTTMELCSEHCLKQVWTQRCLVLYFIILIANTGMYRTDETFTLKCLPDFRAPRITDDWKYSLKINKNSGLSLCN